MPPPRPRFWGGFQARPAEAAARCWWEWPDWLDVATSPPPAAAEQVVSSFVRFLAAFMQSEAVCALCMNHSTPNSCAVKEPQHL